LGPGEIRVLLTNTRQSTRPVCTTADVLTRHQRVAPAPAECQRFERSEPDEVRQLGFNGLIEIQRPRVPPLTILDDHSRFLLALRPCTDLAMLRARNVLWDTFGEYGQPEAVLRDDAFGAPSCPGSRGGSWFESLLRPVIRPLRGLPYHPQTQGNVAGLHGTRVREGCPRLDTSDLVHFATDPDRWRHGVYNAVRPHAALGDRPPVTRWRASSRSRPRERPVVAYPPGSVLRRVGSNGLFHDRSGRILAGRGVAGEPSRIEEADGRVVVTYGSTEVRRIPLDNLSHAGSLQARCSAVHVPATRATHVPALNSFTRSGVRQR
jgi:putative transposase